MASSLRTKLRIAASVLFAAGFWDAVAGRFMFQRAADDTSADADAPTTSNQWRDRKGAVHVHTNYSDGAGDVPTVMEAARAAQIDWLMLCDHNTQQPLRDGWEPRYDERPQLLIGTEVSVAQGAFLLALDMPPQWEPTRDLRPQDAIDEVRAHGGLPLVSLPFDVKHPWRDWDAEGFEGLEVVNLSTVARRHINLLSLAWLLPLYFLRGPLAVLRALVTRPDQALARWDSLTSKGAPSVGIGALDAHALMKIGRKKYPIPSYRDSFLAATTHVLVPATVPTSGPQARAAIYEALRAGHAYFAYDCLGDPCDVTFTAHRTGDAESGAIMGDAIGRDGTDVTLSAHVADPSAHVLLLVYQSGKVAASGRKGRLNFRTGEPGAYRIEAYRYAFRIGAFYFGTRPWFFTNPIYVS